MSKKRTLIYLVNKLCTKNFFYFVVFLTLLFGFIIFVSPGYVVEVLGLQSSIRNTSWNQPLPLTVEQVSGDLALLWSRGGVLRHCTKKIRRVYYGKPPKTGSTTLRFMLYSFALRNNLDICTDALDLYHMNYPEKINPDRVIGTEIGCDVIADEMVFDKDVLSGFAGTRNSESVSFLTSVREPVRHFISIFNFLFLPDIIGNVVNSYEKRLTIFEVLQLFLLRPKLIRELYLSFWQDERNQLDRVASLQLMKPNPQLHSLGVSKDIISDQSKLLATIFEKLKQMRFATVADHFDESMVMLKRIFCWSDEEVMYRRLNTQGGLGVKYRDLPDSLIKRINQFNSGDRLLFEVVNKTLWKMIASFPNFKEELRDYKQKLAAYQKVCESKNSLGEKGDYKTYQCFLQTDIEKIRLDIKNRTINSIKNKLLRLSQEELSEEYGVFSFLHRH